MKKTILESDFRRLIEKLGYPEYLKNQKILITGSLGLIGLYLTKFFLYLNEKNPSANVQVIILVRDLDKAKKRLGDCFTSPNLKIVVHDITIEMPEVGKIDTIIHAASPANGKAYGTNPVSVINSNVLGTNNLLSYAKSHETKSFVYLSTGDVTGEVLKPLISEADYGPLNNTDLRSCYSESKRMAETMCVAWAAQYGIRTLIIRPDHTYGPTIDLNTDNRVFADFVRNIIQKNDITLKSDGSAVRTFCYLQDFLEGFLIILERGVKANVYNISNPEGKIAMSGLANLLSAEYGSAETGVTYGAREYGYLENPLKQRPSLGISKLTELGFSPEISIVNGFGRTIKALSGSP